MLTLGIDTSTDNLGLALIENDIIKAEYNLSLKRKHSEKLLPLMVDIFANIGIRPQAIDAAVVAIGPGSFTGLRIGITTAKILARIFDIPVKGISTLEIMAAGVESEYILPLLDARRERVYYSFYKLNYKENDYLPKTLLTAAGARISELSNILRNYKDKEITVIGEKRHEVIDHLKTNKFLVNQSAAEKNIPRAAVLARLGRDYIDQGQKDDIYELKPTYLKQPQAEIDWQKKYGDN
ncbi:MAG: Inactive metal-dependent proteaseputative molecular chaperone [Halanaerobium sp. 4-GBenrich]|jgi:tRNA threonylcarbamoyladenosine biosynthesis protein TsaB|uniref:Glycoprotease family protein n=1 Tax=Halanaerobium congolense TaxID=54121 RepID=A0A1G6PZ05_9FIRM|nr:tRNA (adenosine(37)-N6)-threonylcarbamoyltransferase complex dimerization subunit type 1 TsaB [Halanaerobium congolense]KXS49608.1 MAG: Inactive metal-dependent proteaseputative molecular chaperone [Halanaerobium sp. T82-1]ODS49835.1 MAG: Inactive metal-dependent proteaseputative molecular chaperone [Halanaerobium sp. 4-GBenrich]OEG63346.1 MAG: tRNA (adenosine(37)-N6)-threonylcarbamoyltransferase complex dimerization subunit type 1 TsaB [Halanaerobium sp. MDAL1]PUU92529.1 MAG: Inactive metal